MRTFSTDTTNDLYILPTGKMAISAELEAVLNVCEKVVQTTMGELILQGDQGIPNFQIIWNGSPNIAQAENAIRSAILSVDGVVEVVELSAFVIDNIFRYSATIRTIYGTGSL